MLVVAVLAALFIGLCLGLLGGGGSILTLPMLVYLLHVDSKAAIPTSLFVVAVTSAVGVAVHAKGRDVKFRVGGLLGATGMASAYVAGRSAHRIPSVVLLVAFGVVMAVAGVVMLKGKRAPSDAPPRPLTWPLVALIGIVVGALSGLLGAGGGFLIVPALTIFGGLPMRHAIGTSLLVIAMQSTAGFAGHVATADLDWTLVSAITIATVAGSLGGARLAKRFSPDTLRRSFACLVVVMALFVFGRELAMPIALALSAITLSAAAIVLRWSLRKSARGSARSQPAMGAS